MKRRIQVSLSQEYSSDIGFEELEQAVQYVRERMDTENLHGVEARLSYERGYYDDVTPSLRIVGYRLETDEEYMLRTKQEDQIAQRKNKDKELQERKLFEKLLKKYGGNQ